MRVGGVACGEPLIVTLEYTMSEFAILHFCCLIRGWFCSVRIFGCRRWVPIRISCIFVVLSGDGSVRLGFLDVEDGYPPIRISLGRVLDRGARIQSLAYRPLVGVPVVLSKLLRSLFEPSRD
ncbi:hypothetical protein KY284_012809 [Solanum tuberosum]|nr:hypothetical protein KY284_012809 [Solanum tuberosum]